MTGRAFIGKSYAHVVLIAVLGLLIYSGTLNIPFQWDEEKSITDNPIVKDLSYFAHPSRAKGFGVLYFSFRDRYIGYLSFALNFKLHGLDVRGYHVVNIALHILNALLVYALVRLTLRTPTLSRSSLAEHSSVIALFVALIFVSHPVQTEAVTYVMGRLPLLMWFFYLSSMVLYAKWRGSRTPFSSVLYALSLLCAVLAMKTKENALTLPLSIALYEFLFFPLSKSSVMPEACPRSSQSGVSSRASMSPLTDSIDSRQQHAGMTTKISKDGYRRLLYLAPFALTLLIVPLSLLSFDKPVGEVIGSIESASRHYTATPRMSYLFTQFRVLVTYVRLLFLPINQNFDYDYPVYNSFLNPQVFLSFLFLLSIFSLGVFFLIRSKRGNPSLRLLAWGIFWFFLTLSVESSIFPIPMIITEYRLYAPSMGISLSVASALFIVDRQRLAIPALVAVTLVLSGTAYARNGVWKDTITLWEDVVKKSPYKARGHYNLGVAYFSLSQGSVAPLSRGSVTPSDNLIDKAIEHFTAAVEIRPSYAEAYYHLGFIYYKKGLPEKAVENYKAVLLIKPDFTKVYNDLGNTYFLMKRYVDARESYLKAVEAEPSNPMPRYNLVLAYLGSGDCNKAESELAALEGLSPEFAERLRKEPEYIKYQRKSCLPHQQGNRPDD